MLARHEPFVSQLHTGRVLLAHDLEAVGRHQDFVVGEVRIRHGTGSSMPRPVCGTLAGTQVEECEPVRLHASEVSTVATLSRRGRPPTASGDLGRARALAARPRRGYALGWVMTAPCSRPKAGRLWRPWSWPPGQWSAPIGRVGMKQTHPLRRPAGRSPRRCGCCSLLLAFRFGFSSDLKDPRPRQRALNL